MKLSLLAGVVTLALSSTAWAQTSDFRVSGGLGLAFNSGISESDVQSTLDNKGFNAQVTDFETQNIGYSIWLGWQAHQYVALDVGYLDFGESKVTAQDGGIGFAKALTEAMPTSGSGFALAVRPTYEFADDWSVYGRLGAMHWSSDFKVSGYKSDASGTDLLMGAGVEYRIAQRWASSLSWDSVKMNDTQNHLVAFNVSYLFGFGDENSGRSKITPIAAAATTVIKKEAKPPETSNEPTKKAVEVVPTRVSVYFDTNRQTPKMVHTSEIRRVLASLGKEDKVLITASADTDGSAEYNRVLAKKRARYISKYLNDKGISYQDMEISILGEVQGEPKSEYRRVDIQIVSKL